MMQYNRMFIVLPVQKCVTMLSLPYHNAIQNVTHVTTIIMSYYQQLLKRHMSHNVISRVAMLILFLWLYLVCQLPIIITYTVKKICYVTFFNFFKFIYLF